MKAINPFVSKEGEKIYIISGEVTEIVTNESSPNLPARVTVRAKGFTPEAPKYVTALCFAPFDGVGFDHKGIAVKASNVALKNDESLWCCIACIQQKTPNGGFSYKARSTSFVKTAKGSCTNYMSPYQIFFKDEDRGNIKLVKGLATGCFENPSYYAISFVEDTASPTKTYVSAKCFAPYNAENPMNNLENAKSIKEGLASSKAMHTVLVCKETMYNDRPQYTAIASFYAERKF